MKKSFSIFTILVALTATAGAQQPAGVVGIEQLGEQPLLRLPHPSHKRATLGGQLLVSFHELGSRRP